MSHLCKNIEKNHAELKWLQKNYDEYEVASASKENWIFYTLCSNRTVQRITIKTEYAQYVSVEDVWHALRACVLNSNGITDPQLDPSTDSTHPPTRPSVQLCIGKQLWCMQTLLCAHRTHVNHRPWSCCFFSPSLSGCSFFRPQAWQSGWRGSLSSLHIMFHLLSPQMWLFSCRRCKNL